MNTELEDRSKVAGCLSEVAALAALQGDQSLAGRAVVVTLYSASSALWRVTYRYTREFHSTILASARSLLAEDMFQSAWDKGQTLTLEAAVELALAQLRISPAQYR
jgi:transposase